MINAGSWISRAFMCPNRSWRSDIEGRTPEGWRSDIEERTPEVYNKVGRNLQSQNIEKNYVALSNASVPLEEHTESIAIFLKPRHDGIGGEHSKDLYFYRAILPRENL